MAILGTIIKSVLELKGKLPSEGKTIDPYVAQEKVLKKLLKKAQLTAFGERYCFEDILKSQNIEKSFKEKVPLHDYNKMHSDWWYRCLAGETYVSWPGKVKYFALSSGTSESSSKYIPVTSEMIKAIKKTSVRTLSSVGRFDVPSDFFNRGILMLGGSTHLNYNGTYYEGDLSGITTGDIPFWFQHHYKPGKQISRERNWENKIEEIIKKAPEWDIGAIVGVPAWFQILLTKIIERYNLTNIHEIWPNLSVFCHGGVSFTPYINSFEKLLGKPLIYMETYLASEGYIAFQDRPETNSMKLVVDNGLYFEFVPFIDKYFDNDGNMKSGIKPLSLSEIELNTDYALLLSSVAGAWRYLIGDVVRFTNKKPHELIIVGRTKHYLSVCGEHLSQENMNRAVEMLEHELGISIPEFTVAGIPFEGMFRHKWWLGCNDKLDPAVAAAKIDEYLKILNDDYRVERIAAIKKIDLEILPTDVFYDYLLSKGKQGSQVKFPRVMKKQLPEWELFLKNYKK